LETSVADPDPVPVLALDPGWLKNQDPDQGSGYRMNIPDHISESLEILKFFAADPIRDLESFWIWDKHLGSAILLESQIWPTVAGAKKVTTYFYSLKSYKKQSMD
jgi:hypothetical protein